MSKQKLLKPQDSNSNNQLTSNTLCMSSREANSNSQKPLPEGITFQGPKHFVGCPASTRDKTIS